MLPFKICYSDGYDLNLGDHVFPAVKFRLIRDRLLQEGVASQADFVEPAPAAMEDILRVHDREWAFALRNGTLSYQQILRLEIPYSSRMVDAVMMAAGGSVEAARLALRDGVGVNLTGGFHHAFAGHGEGFCALHDVAVSIRAMQARGLIQRAMVVDVDVHHGNGTAAIFRHDPTVFTVSLHQWANYPHEKPFSNVDVHLPDGTGDRHYLGQLERVLRPVMDGFAPDLLCYVAGSDPYLEDKLGGLALTMDGLARRDALVFRLARERRIPVAVTLAGGYAVLVGDTVTIHANTVKAAIC